MKNLIFCFIIALCICSALAAQQAPIVQLTDGKVVGTVEQIGQHQVNFYQGIRYGRAERFAKPKSVEPWSGVYNATSWRNACPQFGMPSPIEWLGNYTQTESEDCLFLNVWVPAVVKQNRTVLVWIHGGAYETGTIFSQTINGEVMVAQEDVVLVAINYRLGPLGFLYADPEAAPGNLGLLDQVLALRWVQHNIHRFGGNPADVTIFGISAGGSSVGALYLSPLAKGLFRRAAMQSGAPNSLALTESPTSALAKTRIFAAKLHCPTGEKIADTIHCLKTKSVAELVAPTINDMARNEFFVSVWGDDFMPKAPARLLEQGAFNRGIDLIYGATRDEGTIFLALIFPELIMAEVNVTIAKEYINKLLHISTRLSNTQEVVDYYFSQLKSQNPSSDELKVLISRVFGELHLACPVILMGEAIAKQQPTGANYYSYQMTTTPMAPLLPWMGVTHGADQGYLFPNPALASIPAAHTLSNDMLHAWATFAKTGHPPKMGTTEWLPAAAPTHPHTRFLSMNSANYTMVDDYYVNVCNSFWAPKINA